MGPNETELRTIAAAGEWRVDELALLSEQIQELIGLLGKLGVEPGWDGTSATAASQRFGDLVTVLNDVITSGNELVKAIVLANGVRSAAVQQLQSLPGTFVPDWVYDTIDKGGEAFPFMGWYFDAQKASLGAIESFLGDNREKTAGDILTTYRTELVNPAVKASSAGNALPYVPDMGEDLPDPMPDVPEVVYGPPAGSRGPVMSGLGGYPAYSPPETGYPPPPPPGPPRPPWEGPGYVPDDPGPGYIPSTPGAGLGGPGAGGPGTIGIGAPGGSGAAGLGAGVGAAALAAGVGAKAVGLGAGGLGAAGAAARPGTGGLLGGGGASAGNAGAGRSTSAGGRGLLGNGGTQGATGTPGSARDDAKKRAPGRGLGGAIAPHLDDDENYVPRAAGTRAGGRDEVADAEPLESATD